MSKSDLTSEIQSQYIERSIMCDMHKEEERWYVCVRTREREGGERERDPEMKPRENEWVHV